MRCLLCGRDGEPRHLRSFGHPIDVVLCASCYREFVALPWVSEASVPIRERPG